MSKLARNAAQAVLNDDLPLGGVERQVEADHAPKPIPVAAVDHQDAFQALLEHTYRMLNRPALHSHRCSVCLMERICVQQPCAYRATDLEREYRCGCEGE